MIFKLTQSFFQRFVGGANSPDSKSLTVHRSSLLQYKEKHKCKRIPCVLNTIRGHWTSVEKHFKLSKVFPEPPMVAFKQPNSLRNLLVRAEMSKPNTTIGNSHSCGDKRCKCCKHMQHSSSYTQCLFCKVTPVSIQAFVEGLLRLPTYWRPQTEHSRM
jgi:hypothetical protein